MKVSAILLMTLISLPFNVFAQQKPSECETAILEVAHWSSILGRISVELPVLDENSTAADFAAVSTQAPTNAQKASSEVGAYKQEALAHAFTACKAR